MDAEYAKLRQAEGRIKTREIDDVRLVDYDETGAAAGVELLFVSRAAPFTIDLDSTICETYGLAKEGARHHGYTGVRGYHPARGCGRER